MIEKSSYENVLKLDNMDIPSSYDPPIKVQLDQIRTIMTENYTGNVLKAVCNMGIEIDRQGLLAALNADNERYRKAYQDGWADCKKHYDGIISRIATLIGAEVDNDDEVH